MFKNTKKKKKEKDIDKILCEISHIEDALLILLKRNDAIINEQAELRQLIENPVLIKSDYSSNKKEYSSYEKGTFNTPKEFFFDSPAEKQLENYLNYICKHYSLGEKWGIRLLSHQPVINYVEILPTEGAHAEKLKAVNAKNALMHFDFLFEARQSNLWGNIVTDEKAGHYPLLAIELDGMLHNTEKQINRDEYKQGLCDKIGLPLIRIKYTGEDFTLEKIAAEYSDTILECLFSSLLNLYLKLKKIYLLQNKLDFLEEKSRYIQNEYSEDTFPEVHEIVSNAYKISIEALEQSQ